MVLIRGALRAALGVLVASCAGAGSAEWRQVDANRPWLTVSGRAEVVHVPPHGDCRIEITPDADCAFATAPGQQLLPCIVVGRDRESMWPILNRLRTGNRVQVSGYWNARDEAGAVCHYICQVTAIRIVG